MSASAPDLPHLAIGRFNVFDEGGGIHDGGIAQALAEGGAELLQAREVIGEGDGSFDVLLAGVGEQVDEVHVGEYADAQAGGVFCASEGNDGDSHPEGVAGDGVAGDGEGVEEDVDFVV